MIAATRSKAMTTAAAVGVTLAAVVVIRTQFLDIASVSSDSMAPTVCTEDTVLLARLHGDPVAVDVGDVVTFPSPQDGTPTIKRVVAVGGQRVAIRDAELVVEEQVVGEPYVDHASIDGVYFGPVTVPAGTVFVMGDHRETSIDSRVYGPIRAADIEGRLLLRIGPTCRR